MLRNWFYLKVHLPLVRVREREAIASNSVLRAFITIYYKLFPTPMSPLRKRDFLRKLGGMDIWLETGTYYGETAAYLSDYCREFHSIEPSFEIFKTAKAKTSNKKNVYLYHGSSEKLFEKLILRILESNPKEITFWLDGHYSGGETFLSSELTSIIYELDTLEKYIDKLPECVVLIDDVRCFDPENPRYSRYPDVNYLINWACNLGLRFSLKKDIFIVKIDKKLRIKKDNIIEKG